MLEQFEQVGRAIADPSRVRILKLLERGELCVCQITTVLGLAPATVSKHLSLLKMAGLLQHRRDGKWIYYRISEKQLNPYVRTFLLLVGSSLNDDPVVTEDRRLLMKVEAVPVAVLCEQGRAAFDLKVPVFEITTDCENSP